MSSHPYMPLWIADYLADTQHLTTLEHGAYFRLIMAYWRRGKPLDANCDRLALLAGLSPADWHSIEQTLSEFFIVENDTWRHSRIERELIRAREKSENSRAAGLASAAQRAKRGAGSKSALTVAERPLSDRTTNAERNGQRNGNLSDSDSDSESETDTNTQKIIIHPAGQSDAARENDALAGRPNDPFFEKCQLVLNGTAERAVEIVRQSDGPYGTRSGAAQWLSELIDDTSATAVIHAIRFVEDKQARNERMSNPKSIICKTAQTAKLNETLRAADAIATKTEPKPGSLRAYLVEDRKRRREEAAKTAGTETVQ